MISREITDKRQPMLTYLRHYLEFQKNEHPSPKLPSLKEVTQNYIRYLLDFTHNDREETAKILDVSSEFLEQEIKE
jgi:DNA-binding NtrC family response regulator